MHYSREYSTHSFSKTCVNYNCRRSSVAPMSLKGILNDDIFYLPKCTDFFTDFRKLDPVSNFKLNRFLYTVGVSGKFKPNRFLKCRLLVAGFYCMSRRERDH